MHGTSLTMKFARTGSLSGDSTNELRKPSKTELAFVSPGCTRDVTKIILRFEGWIEVPDLETLLAVMVIFGTGKPQIVLQRS